MKLKKSYPWLALFSALLLVLTACGGGQPAAQPTAAPAADQPTAAPAADVPTPTTVIEFPQDPSAGQKVLVWMVRINITENRWESQVVLPAWQAQNSDVFIKVLSINQDDIAVKRSAMIAAKEPLHVWSPNWGGNGFASDRALGLLTDLTPLIERDKWDTSDFIPEVFGIYNVEGKQYGIPFLTTGSYLYYNMKLFDAAGVPYPPTDWTDKSWTWEKMLETAKQLTKNTDDINNAVFGVSNGLWPGHDSIPMIWGKDPFSANALETGYSDPIQLTDPTTIAAFQAMHDLPWKEKVAPDPSASQALDQLGGAFLSGRVAMFMTGGWGHWNYKEIINDPNGFCWGAAPLPWGTPDANIRATIFTDPWGITAGMSPEETDMAWEFVKFLGSSEQQAAFTAATGTPPTRQSLLNDYYKQYEKCMAPEKVKESFQGAFAHGRESSNHLLVRFDEIDRAFGNLIGTFWDDPNGDAATILGQIETDMNAAISQINQEAGK